MGKSIWWLFLVSPLAVAGEVYKCVGSDQVTSFTAIPDPGKSCSPVTLKVMEPNAEDVARALERERRQEEADRAAQEERQKAEEERLKQESVRAQSLAAEAAMRRAIAAEEELQNLRQQPQPGIYLQPLYPTGIVHLPHSHPLPYNPYPQNPFPQNPFPGAVPYPAMPDIPGGQPRGGAGAPAHDPHPHARPHGRH